MHLRDWLFYKRQGLAQRFGRVVRSRTHPFVARPGEDVAARAQSDLGKLFLAHEGRGITKWVDYLDLYDRHFARFRGKPVKMLEIGVLNGGSLDLWRAYFGGEAKLFGVDINPECADRVSPPNQVRIGSQDDPAFLAGVVEEMGGIDIVLDDGSHIGRHQNASFKALFPLLNDGGLYVIEDLHTAYWPGDFEGGYRRAGTGIDLVKGLIDDMHAWFHDKGERRVAKTRITGVHAYESIVFIERGTKQRPVALDRP